MTEILDVATGLATSLTYEPGPVAQSPAWNALTAAISRIQPLQATDGSIPEPADHPAAGELVREILDAVSVLELAIKLSPT